MRPKTINHDPNNFTIIRCAGEKPEQWNVKAKTPVMTANPAVIPARSLGVLRSFLSTNEITYTAPTD